MKKILFISVLFSANCFAQPSSQAMRDSSIAVLKRDLGINTVAAELLWKTDSLAAALAASIAATYAPKNNAAFTGTFSAPNLSGTNTGDNATNTQYSGLAASKENTFTVMSGKTIATFNYAADAGANDSYVISLNPSPGSYTTGMIIFFKANTVNTGAASINVNGLGAKTIVKRVSTALANGDIPALSLKMIIYDGTNFVLINPVVN